MNILILTYYWPPAGGSGVQRWLYFVKYLREFGIEPVVFTVENPNYPIVDKSLAIHTPKDIEIIREKIWEPNSFLSRKQIKTGAGFLNQNPSLFQRITQYIRANYFIPDARKFWIKPSVKKLLKYIENNPVDWIITTGPPHSVHLIGKSLKEKTATKWLADFRDPWTEIDYFHQLPLTKKSLQKHLKLEKSVLTHANVVSVVSNNMAEKYSKINANCQVITNGFEGEITQKPQNLDKKFTLTHIGMLNADRNPHLFWEVVSELFTENPKFKNHLQINLIGKIAEEVNESIQKHQLKEFISLTSYVPHGDVATHLEKSQVLLLFVNDVPSAKGIVTGKVFEYFLAKRPILAIAPTDGDLSSIIKETQTGIVVGFYDKKRLKEAILNYFEAYLKNSLEIKSKNIEKYHRKNLTKQLAKLLKNN